MTNRTNLQVPSRTQKVNSPLDDIHSICQEIADIRPPPGVSWYYEDQKIYSKISDINHCLTPSQMQEFLDSSKIYDKSPNYTRAIGIIISRLMQVAINHGQVHFNFDLSNLKPINEFANGLSVPHDQNVSSPLEITVRGGKLGNGAFKDTDGTFYVNEMENWYHLTEKSTCTIKKMDTLFPLPLKKTLYSSYSVHLVGIAYEDVCDEAIFRSYYELHKPTSPSTPTRIIHNEYNRDIWTNNRKAYHALNLVKQNYNSITFFERLPSVFNHLWSDPDMAFKRMDILFQNE